MGVSAENAIRLVMFGVGQCSGSHLRRHAQPSRIQPVDHSHDWLVLEVQLLQLQVERSAEAAQADAADLKAIELVAVNGNVAQAAVLPFIVLVDTDADEVRHDVGQPVIVVAFDPHHFDIALGIRQLPDVSVLLQVIFCLSGIVLLF